MLHTLDWSVLVPDSNTASPVTATVADSAANVMRRPIDVFFYGLFMDRELLETKGIRPTNPTPALVRDYELRLGAYAAVGKTPGGRIHGILMTLSYADVQRLYAEPSLSAYRPEAVLALVADGATVPALCYTLPDLASVGEQNLEYARKLRSLAQRLGLPADYVASIK